MAALIVRCGGSGTLRAMFKRLLIANRGEIARRVIRACKKLGVESIAVYSEADRDAPFVAEADHAICIGPARAAQSYLDMEAILAAAVQTEAQAIHPGYGFLAENALFAQMVAQQRLAWVGPPARVIRAMGEKAMAKDSMGSSGLPLIPGSAGVLSGLDEAVELAETMGYPVLLKADAGGGGRGMRRADGPGQIREAWDAASNEALSAFGNGDLYLEKYLGDSRHIEFQILADSWGNAVHLFERECSVQRRHQKLLEEAPSVALSDEVRNELGCKVAAAAAAVGYVGAGTVEFLLDRKSGKLHFMEMNTRLQVEHPVTEMITGIDLVEAQIRIAAGEKLWFSQDDITITGHAIELRLNAEDTDDDFRPTPGTVSKFAFGEPDPELGKVRVDAAVTEGSRVSPFYDSLIAKLICWGRDRDAAIATCQAALSGMDVQGVSTTAPLHQQVLGAEDFVQGDLRVGIIPGRPDLSDVVEE
jgi:acetyl-CoA carboxylase, biotin carboxylase subunit